MSEQSFDRKRHFFFEKVASRQLFSSPKQWISNFNKRNVDRQTHGSQLLASLKHLRNDPKIITELKRKKEFDLLFSDDPQVGILLDFVSFNGVDFRIESLDRANSSIQLRNVKKYQDDSVTVATAFVKENGVELLERLIKEYISEDKKPNGKNETSPKNENLIGNLSNICPSTLESLWTDADKIPDSLDEDFDWEVWLPMPPFRDEVPKSWHEKVASDFRKKVGFLDIECPKGEIKFADHVVLNLVCSKKKLQESFLVLNSNISEIRKSVVTAHFFDDMNPIDQREWSEDLESRVHFDEETENTPYICLLDTGVNNGHPLIKKALSKSDMFSANQSWSVNDINGHGTELAGIALLGDLTPILESNENINISHRLESVKLLDDPTSNRHESYGLITNNAVNLTEISHPIRKRVFSMAVTTTESIDAGKATTWSSTIDKITFGAASSDENDPARLFVISAGNIHNTNTYFHYDALSNSTESIHDPAQAWNALTVGAFTELVDLPPEVSDIGRPVARKGGISPFSSTSLSWDSQWPLKPDVVFEGGNAVRYHNYALASVHLSLLTTCAFMQERFFSHTYATSAASALASKMAAQIMKEYPDAWVETIRAVIVHSATWTPEMLRMYTSGFHSSNKSQFVNLIRHCGFGVPDTGTALWSFKNKATLIFEDEIQPFIKTHTSQVRMGYMNLHDLPLPFELFSSLGNEEVEMRVTLSYFIEPSPSKKFGISSSYYRSHGLRFSVQRSSESESEFIQRVNKEVREDDYQTSDASDIGWKVGSKGRSKGSLHSDIWCGSAAELALKRKIAVIPVTGWWKTNKKLKRYENSARYSLVVSIHVKSDIDLYTEIENLVKIPVVIET